MTIIFSKPTRARFRVRNTHRVPRYGTSVQTVKSYTPESNWLYDS